MSLICQLCYTMSTIFLERQNIISLFEPKYEVIRIINYFIWSLLSCISFITRDYYYYGVFVTNTMILAYLYELIYHKPDKSHTIHHIFVIITQLSTYYTGIFNIEWFAKIIILNYIGLSTSILSSLRHINAIVKYKKQVKYCYMNYYMLCKLVIMILHYNVLFNNEYDNLQISQYIPLITFFILQLIQLYFIYLIYNIITR